MIDPRSKGFLVVFCFMLHVRVLLFLSLSQSPFSCVFFLLLILFLNIFYAFNLSLLFSPVFNHQSHSIFMNFSSPPQNNMAHKLKILSLNVRGLRNTNKRRAIFSYLKDQKATISNLQETFSKPEGEEIWTAEWGGKGFFSHGTEHSKGVTMLIKN